MIAIVTDSSSYLTQAEAAALGVVMVPMSYSAAGSSYQENFVDQNGHFEQLFDSAEETLRTSQATLNSFTTAFDSLRAKGYEVLCLTISSRLSGTYGNAVLAARDLGGKNIAVVDTLTTAAGLYLCIREARRLIDQGLSLAEVAQHITDLRSRVHLVFSVDDIGPLRRSGRLGGIKLSISTILNIRPMLKCQDGAIIATGITRGRHEQQRQLLRAVPRDVTDVVVEQFKAESQIGVLAKELRDAGKSVEMRTIGPVLSIHLGKGCLGVAWIDK